MISVADNTKLAGRIIRYGIAGVAAALLYNFVAAALVELGAMPPVTAAAAATCVAIVFSYAVNRRWIFETNRTHASAFARFVIASGLSMALNTGLMHVVVNALSRPYWMGLILATLVVPPINFVVNQYWAFRPRQ